MSNTGGRQKTALVGGGGGFIGSHLVKRLVKDGYWVRGADQKRPEFSPTAAQDRDVHLLRHGEHLGLPGCRGEARRGAGGFLGAA